MKEKLIAEIQERIEIQRDIMHKAFEKHMNMTHPEVVAESQKLDDLLNELRDAENQN